MAKGLIQRYRSFSLDGRFKDSINSRGLCGG